MRNTPIKNIPSTYSLITRLLHWGMAVLILSVLGLGFIMTRLSPSDTKAAFYLFHKAIGFSILLLVPLRFGWYLLTSQPPLPKDLPTWQHFAARFNIKLLYGLMFIMPLSGTLMSLLGGRPINFFYLFDIPALFTKNPLGAAPYIVHIWVAYLFAAVIALHISAALYHHFVRRDAVLQRMIWKS